MYRYNWSARYSEAQVALWASAIAMALMVLIPMLTSCTLNRLRVTADFTSTDTIKSTNVTDHLTGQ